MRASVASTSGLGLSKIDGTGIDQSMQLAADRYGSRPLPCVGSGQAIGSPSQRATK
jgi:hypothetical protein